MQFADQVVLITGASNGIGRQLALDLAARGALVVGCGRSIARLREVLIEVRRTSPRSVMIGCDVGDIEQVRGMTAKVLADYGRIDILVNNAGIARLGSLLSISDQAWRDTFAVNVDGMFHATRAVVPGMVARRRGAVVNLASWLGRRGNALFGAYAASKFAVIGLTQSLAAEVAPCGVRVNAVCPGIIADTPMRLALDQAGAAAGLPPTEERVKAIPMGRAGTPDDVAKVVVFLASEAAAYVTGAAYDVSGGHWMT